MRRRVSNKNESTFGLDENIKRVEQIRRDTDSIRPVAVSLYDVDYNVKWYIENIVVPGIIQLGKISDIPVEFASPEKWAGIQSSGYLRDPEDKVLCPVIVIRRTGMSSRTDVNPSPIFRDIFIKDSSNALIFQKKYSKENRYDQMSLLSRPPLKEYYAIDLPQYVELQYDITVWTERLDQLNDVVEQFIYQSGKAYGDTYKFISYVDASSLDLTNNIGEDRIVRSVIPLRTKAYLIPEHVNKNQANMKKFFSVNKILYTMETTGTTESITQATGTSKTSVTSTAGAGGVKIDLSTDVIEYLNANLTVPSDSITTNTATFNNVRILTAPPTLPSTDKNSFTYFVNGQLIPVSYVVSIANVGSSVVVTLDTSSLGFTLSGDDVVLLSGKLESV